jgi:hypothetical protein
MSPKQVNHEGHPKIKKERDRVVSLFYVNRFISVYLSATNGNRTSETVIKIKRKPAGRLKHIGRYSMLVTQMRQGAIYWY